MASLYALGERLWRRGWAGRRTCRGRVPQRGLARHICRMARARAQAPRSRECSQTRGRRSSCAARQHRQSCVPQAASRDKRSRGCFFPLPQASGATTASRPVSVARPSPCSTRRWVGKGGRLGSWEGGPLQTRRGVAGAVTWPGRQGQAQLVAKQAAAWCWGLHRGSLGWRRRFPTPGAALLLPAPLVFLPSGQDHQEDRAAPGLL